MEQEPAASRPADSIRAAYEQQQVKGLTFVTARTFFVERFGEELLADLFGRLPAEAKAVFENAEISALYPETHMQDFLHLVYDDVAKGDDEAFLEIIRPLAVAGVSRFFRVLLGLASARFVLKKVPAVFARLRQGTAKLTVEDLGSTMRIHYEGFPFCSDRVYRLLSLGNCQAIVVAATKQIPMARVVVYGRDTMTLEFEVPLKSRPAAAEESRPGESTTAGEI